MTPCSTNSMFRKIFNAYHIIWVTHNSRISQRMIEYSVEKGKPIILTDQDEIKITGFIKEIVEKDRLTVLSYNICGDHVHILLACDEEKISSIVQKLKSISSRKFNLLKRTNSLSINQGIEQGVMTPCSRITGKGKDYTCNHLWAQKYNCSIIETENKLLNCIEYINNNSGALTIIFSCVVAISTVIYALLTARLVSETMKIRKLQIEPRISVTILPREEWIGLMDLRIDVLHFA